MSEKLWDKIGRDGRLLTCQETAASPPMIYLLGMSHTISVVDAFAGPHSPFSHRSWWKEGTPTFRRIPPARSDSPLDGIQAALLTPQFGPPLLPHDPGPPGGPGQFVVSGRYVRLLRSMGEDPDAVLVTLINGHEQAILSMIQHPVPYDFVLPWRDDRSVLPDRQVVPSAVVERQVRDSMGRTREIFKALRAIRPRTRIIQVMPPPPIASQEQILRSQEPFVRGLEGAYRITPLSLRLKYHSLYVRESIAALGAMGIECLLPPEEAMAGDGSLREPYWLGATHGNPAYGGLVLEQIRQRVSREDEEGRFRVRLERPDGGKIVPDQ